MKEEQQRQADRHLETPAEANQDNHINFLRVEEESSNIIADVHNTSTERQKEWREGIEEGREAMENPDKDQAEKQPDSNGDETLGNP